MIEKIRKWFVDWMAEFIAWMANGQAYVAQAKYPIALAVGMKVLYPAAPMSELLWIGMGAFVVIVFLGWFDLKFIRLHQRASEIQTEKYNPYFSTLRQELKKSTR